VTSLLGIGTTQERWITTYIYQRWVVYDALLAPMKLNAFYQSVQQNGSLWAHIFLTKDYADPDPSSAAYREDSVHHVKKRAC
jgi:hypothetical protein